MNTPTRATAAERKSRGLVLAERIKLQHEELIGQLERHIRDVETLLALPKREKPEVASEADTVFYPRYQAYLEHILCELEEGC